MTTYLVVRLHGDEDWDAWGDDWEDHVDSLGEIHWLRLSEGGYRLRASARLGSAPTRSLRGGHPEHRLGAAMARRHRVCP